METQTQPAPRKTLSVKKKPPQQAAPVPAEAPAPAKAKKPARTPPAERTPLEVAAAKAAAKAKPEKGRTYRWSMTFDTRCLLRVVKADSADRITAIHVNGRGGSLGLMTAIIESGELPEPGQVIQAGGTIRMRAHEKPTYAPLVQMTVARWQLSNKGVLHETEDQAGN